MAKHHEHSASCDGCQILGLMAEVERLRAEVIRLGGADPKPPGWRVPALVSPTTGLYVIGHEREKAATDD